MVLKVKRKKRHIEKEMTIEPHVKAIHIRTYTSLLLPQGLESLLH